jgi:hypothetical protein
VLVDDVHFCIVSQPVVVSRSRQRQVAGQAAGVCIFAWQLSESRHAGNTAALHMARVKTLRVEEMKSVQVWRAVAVALNRMLYNDIATEAAFSPQVGRWGFKGLKGPRPKCGLGLLRVVASRLRTRLHLSLAAVDGILQLRDRCVGRARLLMLLELSSLGASTLMYASLARVPT